MPADVTVEPPPSSLSGVARVLVNANKLSSKVAEELSRSARERKVSFVSAVIAAGSVKPDELALALANALALPLLDLNAIDLQKLPRNVLDQKIAGQYQVLVLGKRGNRLFIAAADPTDQEAAERIKFATQLSPEWVIVEYDKLMRQLEAQGVIFMDTDTALREHPEFFDEYFGTVIPAGDNKFAALNTAVWSGGSFVYVPKGVHVEIPLQAYFRINTENMGQFERTLIIADEGSYVHYIEGCTAPIYKSDSLHSAVVEIVVKKNARVRYTTIQNWSNNVYNLVTKRAIAHEGATMEWIDGNIGSKVTMKYPSIYLVGEHAKGETLSVAFAGPGQHQDAGAKMVHMAPYTTSSIVSKSIARGGGRAGYRGEIRVDANAHHSANTVRCDALLVDTISRSDTYPSIDIRVDDVQLGHEATVSRVSAEQLFYLQSRGLAEDEAMAMIVRGFIEPIARELPMEYALELNKLIEMSMEGSVG